MAESFPKRQVDRSFRKFNDIVTDLERSTFQTWDNTFANLMTHCEKDPVMRLVTQPLRDNQNVNAKQWYDDAMSTRGSMIGSGRYELPYDDDDRTALLYQFFLELEYGDHINMNNFCMSMYGHTRFQDMVDTFNSELVNKFTREVSYRLDEILQDAAGLDSVPSERMFVFHHHDNSVTIHGAAQGALVATGQSTVSHANVSYNDPQALATAVQGLTSLLEDLAGDNHTAVKHAIDRLADAALKNAEVTETLIDAAKTVATASPSLAKHLKDIAGAVGKSLASSGVVKAITLALAVRLSG